MNEKIKQFFCNHRFEKDGMGYILFDGYGLMYCGKQEKIRARLRKCVRCNRSDYNLNWECGNGRRSGKWYKNTLQPLRKLKYE